MYLERYRKTKVSNILRASEGRILPAVHSDGSVIQVRGIITRSDTNDGNGKMLFKGVIKRGDTGGASGAGGKRGFRESFEIILNKSGIITSVTRKVLTMLGYSKDRPISEFVGNPAEIFFPPLEEYPSQERSAWMHRGLRNPNLNFYLWACTNFFSVLPVAYNLTQSADGETIKMTVRDMSELDALVTIDEEGNIMTVNDDAFILLGFDPDEVVGKNINRLQPPEVPEKQDNFLFR